CSVSGTSPACCAAAPRPRSAAGPDAPRNSPRAPPRPPGRSRPPTGRSAGFPGSPSPDPPPLHENVLDNERVSETFRPLSPHLADRLRGILLDADYTVSGVRDRLGDTAARALAREQLIPALRATGGEERLGLLLRLWWLGEEVPEAALRALPLAELAEAGLLAVRDGRVRALVQVKPWELADGRPGYTVSDPTVRPGRGQPRPDHVVGAGGASATLAQLVVDGPVDRALDLGSGCGVQSLHLAERANRVCATDVNPRALWMTRISCALSG